MQYITRAEALKVLLESKKVVLSDSLKVDYPDVEDYAWYYKYIAYATDKGIVTGYKEANSTDQEPIKFRPNSPITRAEFLKMLYLSNQI